MNLIETKYLHRCIDLLEGNEKVAADRLRVLCLFLLRSCTPYLGYHAKAERILEEFVVRHHNEKPATKRRLKAQIAQLYKPGPEGAGL
jgi:hypothetical protein